MFNHFYDTELEGDLYAEHNKEIVYNGIILLLEYLIPEKSNIIIDATYHLQARRATVIEAMNRLNERYLFIETIAPIEIIKQRMKERKTTETDSDALIDQYFSIKQDWEDFDDITKHTVDTSGDKEVVIDEILDIIHNQY